MPQVRFAIEGDKPNEFCSDRWTVFTDSNDIYLLPKGMAGSCKISVHESGICRYALTEQLGAHQLPTFEDDRVIIKWRRGTTESVLHTHVLSIIFVIVGGGISKPAADGKQTIPLPCPHSGYATEVALFLSETDPSKWQDKEFITRNIIANMTLQNDTYATLRRRVVPFSEDEFQALLGNAAGLNSIHIGGKNPDVVDPGPSEIILPLAWPNYAKFYHIAPITMPFLMGVRANWSTRKGNRFPSS